MNTADENVYWREQTCTGDENRHRWEQVTTAGEPVRYRRSAVRVRRFTVLVIEEE